MKYKITGKLQGPFGYSLFPKDNGRTVGCGLSKMSCCSELIINE